MKKLISDAMDFVDDSYIAEAMRPLLPSEETEKEGK